MVHWYAKARMVKMRLKKKRMKTLLKSAEFGHCDDDAVAESLAFDCVCWVVVETTGLLRIGSVLILGVSLFVSSCACC